MATNKNKNTVQEAEVTTEPHTEAMNLVAENEALKAELEAMKAQQGGSVDTEAPKTEAPKEKMVKIRIPRTKKDEEDVFVSVNHYTCIIKRGVEVEVPDFVAEVLRHQEEMLEKIMDFEESVQKNK